MCTPHGSQRQRTPAYNEPHQRYVFYEIDPVVVDIARDPTLFTFLGDAPGVIDVVQGDGRLEIEKATDASYDVIVLDAFSSDAIPAHLVTREAIEVYLSKLKPDGVLVANVSNAYLDVASVVSAAASANDLVGYVRTDSDLDDVPAGDKEASSWVAASRDPQALAFLAGDEQWMELSEVDRGNLWTDDFSDILSVHPPRAPASVYSAGNDPCLRRAPSRRRRPLLRRPHRQPS